MDEMFKMMRYHSRVGRRPVTFTRTELYNLMEKVWPYVSKSPLRNHFPTTAVWAQYTRKHNAHEENTSSIVSTRQWRTEYEDGTKVQRQTTRWAVHLPPHHRGLEDSQ
jgi:hypothetical protein